MGLPTVETHWFDPLLPFVPFFRVAVVLITVTAGVVALFTDRALVDREKPLSGIWKFLRNTPLESRKLSPWGYRILAVLFFAGILQFCGDWLKDKASDHDNDVKLAKLTKDFGDDVGKAVGEAIGDATRRNVGALNKATEENRSAFEGAVQSETDQVVRNIGDRLTPVIGQQKEIAGNAQKLVSSTNTLVDKVNKELHPFKNVGWSWFEKVNTENPRARLMLSSIGVTMKNHMLTEYKIPPSPVPGKHIVELEGEVMLKNAVLMLLDSSMMEAKIVDKNGETYHQTSLTVAPRFEEIVDNLQDPLPTEFRCFVVEGAGTYERPDCDLDAYMDAPAVDDDAPKSKLHYLDELAGKFLILTTPLKPADEVLLLEGVCLHVGNQAICFAADAFEQRPRSGEWEYSVQFPPDLDSILDRMMPGTLERTSLAKDLPQVFTLPE